MIIATNIHNSHVSLAPEITRKIIDQDLGKGNHVTDLCKGVDL
jgi:hypothetical protein